MSVAPRRALAALLPALAVAACTAGDNASRVTARVDTLPSGTIRITSDQPLGWSDSTGAWTITKVLEIQGEDGTGAELVEPGTIGVDDAGRIYVSDRKPAVIKVFDSTGTLVRTIGREGSGPGEFRTAFFAVRGSRLVVHDPQQSRTSVFDTAGAFQTSWVSACCMWMDIGIDQSDRIYIPTPGRGEGGPEHRGIVYVRYRFDGSIVDTLFVPAREDEAKTWTFSSGSGSGKGQQVMQTGVPFAPRAIWAFDPAGGFVGGWTTAFRIVSSATGRDTVRIVERAWTADPIPESTRRAEVEAMVKMTKDMVGETKARSIARIEDIPDKAPAFTTIKVDLDGNLWARHLIGSDSTRTRYSVFGKDGGWLGDLVVPAAISEWGGQLFGHGVIYASTEGADGRPAVIKLRVTPR